MYDNGIYHAMDRIKSFKQMFKKRRNQNANPTIKAEMQKKNVIFFSFFELINVIVSLFNFKLSSSKGHYAITCTYYFSVSTYDIPYVNYVM